MSTSTIVSGYWLNRAFNDLREPAARKAWLADLDSYLARYPLTDEEKHAVRSGDWPGCIALGASVYTLTKVGATIGMSLLEMGAQMRGQTMAEFVEFLKDQNVRMASYHLVPDPAEDVDG
jgi:protocatechuate 4,5-dioxygenase alpha subunit